jgi:two-component system chemotaxis sensor kinase CheA
VRTDLLDQVVNLSGELLTHRFMLQRAAAARDWSALDGILAQAARLVDDLHHRSLQARLMPVESIAGRIPRLVRDLARKSGKQIEFKLVGGGVGLDRLILEELADPLVHLVRNAVDHGIAESGEITVAARREKDLVLVEVSDNGRGMNPVELRRQAVERGLLTAGQAMQLSDRDALMLVCLPGFSTARMVTETSGRGVGMDVVKAAVEKLGGTLDILSFPGEGTCFQLRLPLSMAIIRLLLVDCADRSLAIPLTRVQRTLELPMTEVQWSSQRRCFRFEDGEVELFSLGELLAIGPRTEGETLCVVVTEAHGRRIGIQVDGFLGQREAFVKSLGFPLDRLPGLSGATVEADGRIVFIVDPHPLLEKSAASFSPRTEEDPCAVS